jgi:hypothetical protein
VRPLEVANALIVVVVVTAMGAAYAGEAAVGVEPSMV